MGERVHKSFRLPRDLAVELDEFAGSHDMSATAVAEAALREYLSRSTPRGTSDVGDTSHRGGADEGDTSGDVDGTYRGDVNEAIHALTAQLAVKDAQIARLMDALSQAQETAKAAQVLDAAHTAKALEGETGDLAGGGETVHSAARGERGILQRIRERFGWGSK